MANLLVDIRDQQFNLYEMLDLAGLTKYPKFGDYSKDMFDMVLTEAEKMAVNVIFPSNAEGDKEGCSYANGKVTIPKGFKDVYKKFVDGGWITIADDAEVGGQGFPEVINVATKELFGAANFSFVMYPGRTWTRCTRASGAALCALPSRARDRT
jgi:alkylation response protein AidB-like acyl-CoA dehydrogenase